MTVDAGLLLTLAAVTMTVAGLLSARGNTDPCGVRSAANQKIGSKFRHTSELAALALSLNTWAQMVTELPA